MINASRIFYAYFFLFLSDECQAIAQRQDDYFYPRVVGNQVIECSDALGLMVTVVGWVVDVPVPQRIVCQNLSARIQNLHHHLVCLDIGALVAIHESQVKHHPQFGCFFVGIANTEINLVGNI